MMEIEVRPYEVVNGDQPWERETRFAVFEKGTGKKLDDAQGWGYKSAKKAYAAWHYKNRSPAEKKKAAQLERKVRKWMKDHAEFCGWMDDEAFYAMKDGEEFGAAQVEEMLKSENLKLDFPARDLLRVWRKF